MANMSKYREDANLNWLRGTAFPAPPTSVYLFMNAGDPTDLGTGGSDSTAALGGAIPVTFGPVSAANTDAEQISNTAVAQFANATSSTFYSHFLLRDGSAASANLLASAPVTGVVVTAAAAASNGSTSLSVASASGINVNGFVIGAGIPSGTTVASISGTTVTLSQAATVSSGASLSFNAIQVGAGTGVSFPVNALVEMIA